MCTIHIKRAPNFQMAAGESARSCVIYMKNRPPKIKSFWNHTIAIQVVLNAGDRCGHHFISYAYRIEFVFSIRRLNSSWRRAPSQTDDF